MYEFILNILRNFDTRFSQLNRQEGNRNVSYLMRITHEIHFAWRAQYLVKLECHLSWQAQHLVQFWEIAGARKVVFCHTKCV